MALARHACPIEFALDAKHKRIQLIIVANLTTAETPIRMMRRNRVTHHTAAPPIPAQLH